MQHPDIFVTEGTIKESEKITYNNYSSKNIDTMLLHGMQDSYMYKDLERQLTNMYDIIQYQRCLSDSKIISTTLSLAKVDPNSLGLSIYGKPGYFTRLAGEVAYILQCKPHLVTIRTSRKCYNEIPVYYLDEGRKIFITKKPPHCECWR